MQTESVKDYRYTAEVIDFNSKKAMLIQQNRLEAKTDKACFRTDKRYLCRERSCNLWAECQKLVAEWMR